MKFILAAMLLAAALCGETPPPLPLKPIPDALKAAYWRADSEVKSATLEKQTAAIKEAEAQQRKIAASQAIIKFCAEQDTTATATADACIPAEKKEAAK